MTETLHLEMAEMQTVMWKQADGPVPLETLLLQVFEVIFVGMDSS